MREIKVSVIIPVYNQEKLVIRALDSIPDRADIEVIAYNDGSTDKTWEVLGDYAYYKRPKMFVFGSTINRGVSEARNQCLQIAHGEYVVMLDSDDYFYTTAFNNVMAKLDGTDMVYYNLMVNSGQIWRVTPQNRKDICGAVKFIRREFIGLTRYPVGVKAGEDWHFNNELLAKHPTEKFTDITVLHYNWPREGSLCYLRSKGKL